MDIYAFLWHSFYSVVDIFYATIHLRGRNCLLNLDKLTSSHMLVVISKEVYWFCSGWFLAIWIVLMSLIFSGKDYLWMHTILLVKSTTTKFNCLDFCDVCWKSLTLVSRNLSNYRYTPSQFLLKNPSRKSNYKVTSQQSFISTSFKNVFALSLLL